MAAEAAARTREDELRAAMAQAGRQHDALLAREPRAAAAPSRRS